MEVQVVILSAAVGSWCQKTVDSNVDANLHIRVLSEDFCGRPLRAPANDVIKNPIPFTRRAPAGRPHARKIKS